MISLGKKLMLVTAPLLASGALYATPAAAQATRTWVSGVGDDANPCSRTAPCKTFAGSISKTAAGGEINCIDPGGFGAVTITKSISIICDDVEAGILVAGSPGITINAGVNDAITISGLDILGPSPSSAGTNGINFLNGGVLNVRQTTIKGFATNGILFQPQNSNAQLNLDDVILTGNGTFGDASTGTIKVAPNSTITATVTLNNVRISGNSGTGIFANGIGAIGRVGSSTITGNGSGSAAAATGVSAAGSSTLSSYGTNVLDGNFNNTGAASNGAFTGTIILH